MKTITLEEYIKKNGIQLQINKNNVRLMQRLLDFFIENIIYPRVSDPRTGEYVRGAY